MIHNPFSLEGKTVLITGASSGIGRAMAVACSRMGCRVVATGRDRRRLAETVSALEGDGHLSMACDLNSPEETAGLVEAVPALDGFVANAGCNRRMLCQYIKEGDMDLVMRTNLISPILLVRLLLKAKKIKRGGSIVFTSSIAVSHSSIGDSVYSATKGGIQSFSKVLALELANKQIRVNTIQPGMVRTGFVENSILSAEDYAADEKRYPLGRYGKPEEIALAAVYLLSDATTWMTGSSVVMDGGISLV